MVGENSGQCPGWNGRPCKDSAVKKLYCPATTNPGYNPGKCPLATGYIINQESPKDPALGKLEQAVKMN